MDSNAPVIGLLADPGTPELVAARIADAVAERISDEAGRKWVVEVSEETLPLSPAGTIDLTEHAPDLRRRHNWDYVIYLSDLPRYVEGRPIVGEISAHTCAALISLPALGPFRLAARARDLALAVVRTAMEEPDQRPDASAAADAQGRPGVEVRRSTGENDLMMLVLTGRALKLRMLGGMVRSNRPGKLLPALKGCIAAAVATGAFGIFYGSMAPVADALSLWRLALVSLMVTGVLAGWLIIRNKLWNSKRNGKAVKIRALDNASTVLTVGISVALLYVLLVAVMLVLSFAVLDSQYLQGELLHTIGVLDYLKLAWLAASMGTMAGALGANFDSEDVVREATYSLRFHQRRVLFDSYGDNNDDENTNVNTKENAGSSRTDAAR